MRHNTVGWIGWIGMILIAAMAAYHEELARAGVLLDASGLQPSSKGWRVRYAPVARFVHYHQRQSLIRAPWELLTNRIARVHIASGVRYFLKYRGMPHPPKVSRDVATFFPSTS